MVGEFFYSPVSTTRIDMTSDVNQYAVGWGALALINANIAQLKGRSGLWWFLGSLIAGPVATFFLAFVEKETNDSGNAR